MQITGMQTLHHPGRWAFAAMVAANLVLALGPWMVRASDVGPVAAGFWRMALAVPLLLLLARRDIRRVRLRTGIMVAVIAGGLFFAADLAAWHVGIAMTKLANATLFGNAAAFLFAIYGFILLRTMPRPLQAAALTLAVIGTMLLLGSSYELSRRHLVGDLFALLAGVFYTFYLIAIDRARRTLAPLPVLALATIAGAPLLLILSLGLGEQVMPHDWTPLLLLALGSQVIGQGLLVFSIGHLSPVIVGLGFLIQPLVSALIGRVVYSETIGPADAAGALLICLALVLIRVPAPRRVAAETP